MIDLNLFNVLSRAFLFFQSTIAYLQDVVRTIGETPTDSRTAVPKKTVKIIDCGIVGIEKKYELTEAQAESNEDL